MTAHKLVGFICLLFRKSQIHRFITHSVIFIISADGCSSSSQSFLQSACLSYIIIYQCSRYVSNYGLVTAGCMVAFIALISLSKMDPQTSEHGLQFSVPIQGGMHTVLAARSHVCRKALRLSRRPATDSQIHILQYHQARHQRAILEHQTQTRKL